MFDRVDGRDRGWVADVPKPVQNMTLCMFAMLYVFDYEEDRIWLSNRIIFFSCLIY